MNPRELDAYNLGYSNGAIDMSLGHRSMISYLHEPGDTGDSADPGARWRYWYTVGYRDAQNDRERRRA